MCSDSWFIDEEQLDQHQLEVIRNAPARQSFLVTGCAGSGKTNLAIWKAQDINDKKLGSYLLIVYTKTLRIFIEDGILNAELDTNKVMHYKLWEHNGKPSADYLIVDEAQDFTVSEIDELKKNAKIALILYGDPDQQIYKDFPNRENLINLKKITPIPYPGFNLIINHRLPKKIARVANQFFINAFNKNIQLVAHCAEEGIRMPLLLEISDPADQYRRIVNQIQAERLTHVGILLPYRKDVTRAYEFLRDLDINIQVRTENESTMVTAEDLSFNDSTIPKLCTYHSAKGLQFHHVFLAECSIDFPKFYPALYVALTRTCEGLNIFYSGNLCPEIDRIDSALFNNQVESRQTFVNKQADDLPF